MYFHKLVERCPNRSSDWQISHVRRTPIYRYARDLSLLSYSVRSPHAAYDMHAYGMLNRLAEVGSCLMWVVHVFVRSARVAILWNNYVWTLVKYELLNPRCSGSLWTYVHLLCVCVCPSQLTTELPRHLHFLLSVNRSGLSGVCCNKKGQTLLLHECRWDDIVTGHSDERVTCTRHGASDKSRRSRRRNHIPHCTHFALATILWANFLTIYVIFVFLHISAANENDLLKSPLRRETMESTIWNWMKYIPVDFSEGPPFTFARCECIENDFFFSLSDERLSFHAKLTNRLIL